MNNDELQIFMKETPRGGLGGTDMVENSPETPADRRLRPLSVPQTSGSSG